MKTNNERDSPLRLSICGVTNHSGPIISCGRRGNPIGPTVWTCGAYGAGKHGLRVTLFYTTQLKKKNKSEE